MKMVRIIGTGAYLPKTIIDNVMVAKTFAINKVVNSRGEPITPERINETTGVKERRKAWDGQTSADLATIAAIGALRNSKVLANQIDAIYSVSTTPDYGFPATAAQVQKNLGIENQCEAFDISAACAGSVIGIRNACDRLMAEPSYRNILVVSGERVLTCMANWQTQNADLWGDMGSAVVIGSFHGDSRGILASVAHTDGSLTHITASRGYGFHEGSREETAEAWMNGPEVYRYAITAIPEIIKEALDKAGVVKDEVRLIISHQANKRILVTAADRLKIPIGRFFANIEKYGNTSSASLMLALHEALKEGRIESGDIVVLVGFGGGMTAGAIVIRW